MNNNYLICALALVSIAATGTALSEDPGITKIERKNGALHSEFIQLIEEQVKQLKSGTGRIALKGGSGVRNCSADLYIGDKTTFVSLNVGSLGYTDEFYIDHPSETFKNILFQNRTESNSKTMLNVDRRNGGFTIKRENDNIIIMSRKNQKSSPECKFALSKANYFDGETE